MNAHTKIENQMMKMLKSYGLEMVKLVCEKYSLPLAEAQAYIESVTCPSLVEKKARGAPEKKPRKVVNKVEMVEDLIQTVMNGTAPTQTETQPAVTETPQAVPEKKKKAPAKKASPPPADADPAQPAVPETPQAVPEKKKKAPAKKALSLIHI